jgi:hypothetical protein
VVKEDKLTLKAGSAYTSRSFSQPGVPKQCIEFEEIKRSAFEVVNKGRQVRIEQDLQIDVYYRCQRTVGGKPSWASNCEEECDICCEIYFGEMPETK